MKKSNKSKAIQPQINNGPAEMDFSYFSPVEVKVYNNFERAMKIFRSLVQSEKILSTYKEKQAYEKPSDKKRRKISENIRRCLENEIKQKKIISGEYEREKIKKQALKDKRKKERGEKHSNGR